MTLSRQIFVRAAVPVAVLLVLIAAVTVLVLADGDDEGTTAVRSSAPAPTTSTSEPTERFEVSGEIYGPVPETTVPAPGPATTAAAPAAPPAAAMATKPTVTGLYSVEVASGSVRRLAAGRVYFPRWSPDGSLLMFVRGNQIVMVEADGSRERTLGALGSVALAPAWSPDAQRIAFVSEAKLAVAEPDGGGKRTIGGENVHAVDWSPDGSRIAVIDGNRLDVYDVANGQHRTLRTTAGYDGKVRWSPDSKLIGYLDFEAGPSVVDASSGEHRPLTTQRNMGWPVTWAPGSDRVAFADYLGNENNLAIASAGGGDVRTIARGAVAPAWSGDGGLIAFQGNREPDRRGELLTHLFVIAPDGTGERRLVTDTRATHVGDPVWSPSGREIAFDYAD